MDASVRDTVRKRANGYCEYCRMPELATPFVPFHVEHIIAKQHYVDNTLSNLALACDRCNAYKGPNLASVDPTTGEIVNLFNPRYDEWNEHFQLVDATVRGLTPKGSASVHLLQMNARPRIQLRDEWISSGGIF